MIVFFMILRVFFLMYRVHYAHKPKGCAMEVLYIKCEMDKNKDILLLLAVCIVLRTYIYVCGRVQRANY
jgi:hypothetical protein